MHTLRDYTGRLCIEKVHLLSEATQSKAAREKRLTVSRLRSSILGVDNFY